MAMGPTLEPRSGERYGLASRGWTAPRVLLAVQRAYLLPHRCAGPYRRSSQKRVLYSQKLNNNAPFQVDFLKSGRATLSGNRSRREDPFETRIPRRRLRFMGSG